jgi:FKBP-type peptidyl-prolyl cis-trans isomerase
MIFVPQHTAHFIIKHLRNMKRLFYPATLLLLSLLAIGLQACFPDSVYPDQEQMEKDDKEVERFLSENNINAEKSERGYYFEALKTNPEGTAIQAGNIVELYYTISTMEGTLLESRTAEGDLKPLTVKHLSNNFMPIGADFALEQMREGEKFRFYLPSYLAFWSSTFEGVEAHTNITLEIEVVQVFTEEEYHIKATAQILEAAKNFMAENNLVEDSIRSTDSGLHYIILKEGEGDNFKQGSRVSTHYTGRLLNNKKFDSSYDRGQPYTFYLDIDNNIPGWKEFFYLVNKGTLAKLYIPYDLAYGSKQVVIPSSLAKEDVIPPFANLTFDIEVLESK